MFYNPMGNQAKNPMGNIPPQNPMMAGNQTGNQQPSNPMGN